jgi:branched-chain amino acid transport system substrate-binding protein
MVRRNLTRSNLARAIRLAAAASALLVVAACGGGAAAGSGGQAPIRIGAIYTLSGPTASIGEVYRSAAELWVKENPTIAGRPVELVVRDDKGTTDGGTEAARSLVDQEEVDAVVGPSLSGPTTAVLPVLTRSKTFSVTMSSLPEAGDPAENPYTVQIEAQKRLEAPSTVAAAASAGAPDLGLLVVDNPLGQTTVDTITAALSGSPGSRVVGVEKFQTGATDVTAQVRKLVGAGATTLVIQAVGVPDYATALKAVQEIGFAGPILGNSALAQPALARSVPAELLGRARASGFTRSVLGGSLTPQVEAFRTKLHTQLGTNDLPFFLYLAATSYDSLGLVKAAAEGTGSTDGKEMVDHLVAKPVEGLRLTYRFSADNHLGLTAQDLAWGVAGTFRDGVVQGEPGPRS